MVKDLESVMGNTTVNTSMDEAEHRLFEELKAAMLSKDNLSRHTELVEKYVFEYADCEVLLGQIRHSCLGCYPGDVGYIKDCHHSPYNKQPCSLWNFRCGKINRSEIKLTGIGSLDEGHIAGVCDEKGNFTELVMYVYDWGKEQDVMFRWIPQNEKSITYIQACEVAEEARDMWCGDEDITEAGWEEVPENEG